MSGGGHDDTKADNTDLVRLEAVFQADREARHIRDAEAVAWRTRADDKLDSLRTTLETHARAASDAARAQTQAAADHDTADTARFARLEWAAWLGDNWKKALMLMGFGLVMATALGSHGPEAVAAIIKAMVG